MPPIFESLTRKHPTWTAQHETWELYRKVMEGGVSMNATVRKAMLLNPDGRTKEVVESRAKGSTYVNVIGSTVTRLLSQLFQQNGIYEGDPDPFWADTFFSKNAFLLDKDDDARASFQVGIEAATRQAFIEGQAIAEISVRYSGQASSLRQQQDLGENQPYVVLLPRSAMWDWHISDRGFEFVKIHRFRTIRTKWNELPIPEHHFSIFERDGDRVLNSQYTVRLKQTPADGIFKLEGKTAEDLVIEPVVIGDLVYENIEIFNVNGKFAFPIVTLTLPDNLWLVSQLYDLCREFFNIRAGINWKFQSVNFAMPVITLPKGMDAAEFKSEYLGLQKIGDGYVLYLPNESSYGTLEPGSSGISTAISYLDRIKQDINEQLQQIAMSASSTAAGLNRGVDSKKEDRKPEVLMLEVIGYYIKQFIQQILYCAAIAHGKETEWTVKGFDNFLGDGLSELVLDLTAINLLEVPSNTFKQQMNKEIVQSAGTKYKLDPVAIAKAIDEITKEPTEADLQSTIDQLTAATAPPMPNA